MQVGALMINKHKRVCVCVYWNDISDGVSSEASAAVETSSYAFCVITRRKAA
jgi:hypothetical protein